MVNINQYNKTIKTDIFTKKINVIIHLINDYVWIIW
jgi:hypothetical protein